MLQHTTHDHDDVPPHLDTVILFPPDATELRAHLTAILDYIEIERERRQRRGLPVRHEQAAVAVAVNALDILERNGLVETALIARADIAAHNG